MCGHTRGCAASYGVPRRATVEVAKARAILYDARLRAAGGSAAEEAAAMPQALGGLAR